MARPNIEAKSLSKGKVIKEIVKCHVDDGTLIEISPSGKPSNNKYVISINAGTLVQMENIHKELTDNGFAIKKEYFSKKIKAYSRSYLDHVLVKNNIYYNLPSDSVVGLKSIIQPNAYRKIVMHVDAPNKPINPTPLPPRKRGE